jgi:predicted phage-related endonuclease
MKGVSKYQSRNDLLKQKATGLVPEIDSHTQRIFDDGHKAEAAARPIAETEIDDELFPVVLDDAEGGFLASMDGLTMCRKIGWEHKSFNASLAAQIDAGQLDEHYLVQLDQQFALSGAERILFTASDGTDANCKHLWIERDESRFAAVEAGWMQFAKDLAEYIPAEAEEPKAEGKAPESLPALVVRASGMVEASNLKEFEAIARATLAGINTDLQTDNDFADAEKAVKFCTDVEKRLDGARENVLGQMQTVDEVVRSIDAIKEETRQIRLKLSKAVKDQKESRKLEILTAARAAHGKFYNALERALEDEAGGIPITLDESKGPDFAGAMKGKRTLSSLNDACDDLLARTKIELNETAEIIRGNIRQLNENAGDYKFLFSDFGHLSQYSAESFAGVMNGRIAGHKQAEHDRLEAERAKIRAEEELKARREAEMASKKAEDERQQEADQQALKQKQAEQNKRLAAEAETAKAEMASREQYDEGQKAAKQPAPVAAKAAQPTPVNKGAHPERPSTAEIISVLASHYGVDTGVVALWIHELKVQEAA